MNDVARTVEWKPVIRAVSKIAWVGWLMIAAMVSTPPPASGATTGMRINSATADVTLETLALHGVDLASFGTPTVSIGDTILQGCTVTPQLIECSIAGTPAIAGGGTWIVRLSAGSAPHQNAEIHVFVPVTQAQRCQPGDLVQCYSGDPATRGIGLCRSGARTCLSDGTWSVCQGEVLPTEEICGDGLDNNCNGTADEGCSSVCQPGNACDDGNACTVNDVCDASGACGGTPVVCPTLSSCMVGTCDAASGGCLQTALPDGTVCSAGETSGVCVSGECVTQ